MEEFVNVSGHSMMIGQSSINIQLLGSGDHNQDKGNQLNSDQPNINHSDVGHRRKLVHDTEKIIYF